MFGSKIAFVILFILISVQIVEPRRYFRGYRRSSECSVRSGKIKVIRNGCSIKIPSRGCHGQCLSSVQPRLGTTGFASSCSCCAPLKAISKTYRTTCRGKPIVLRYPIALRCACRPC